MDIRLVGIIGLIYGMAIAIVRHRLRKQVNNHEKRIVKLERKRNKLEGEDE